MQLLLGILGHHSSNVSPLMYILSFISAVCWLMVYGQAIYLGFLNKKCYLPTSVICLNLGWEFLGIFASDYVAPWNWLCIIATAADLAIFATAWLYAKGVQPPNHQSMFRPVLAGGLIYLTIMQYVFARMGVEDAGQSKLLPLGGLLGSADSNHVAFYSIVMAYLINLFMSHQFINISWPMPHNRSIAMFKLLGTAIVFPIVLLMNLELSDLDNVFLVGVTMGCAALDGIYYVLISPSLRSRFAPRPVETAVPVVAAG